MNSDLTPHNDFTHYLDWAPIALLGEYASIAARLADLHVEIAWQRICEARDKTSDKTVRFDLEGQRDALIERKFLLVRLLENVKML